MAFSSLSTGIGIVHGIDYEHFYDRAWSLESFHRRLHD